MIYNNKYERIEEKRMFLYENKIFRPPVSVDFDYTVQAEEINKKVSIFNNFFLFFFLIWDILRDYFYYQIKFISLNNINYNTFI